MANENQQMPQGTSLDALASLMKLFVGGGGSKTVEQGGTQNTVQTSANALAPDVIAQFLKQALESNSGLVSTLQGQKTAGLYNSSTNRLLANDLLARMSAQAATNAAQVGGKTVTTTQTGTPSTRVTTNQGALGTNGDLMGKLMLGLTAYQKLGGKQAVKDASSMLGISSSVPAVDMISANLSQDPIGALAESQGWFDSGAGVGAQTAVQAMSALDIAGLGGDQYQTFAPENWEAYDFSFVDTSGAQAAANSVSADEWAAFDASAEEYMKNFSGASATNTGTAGASSSEILSQSEQSANTTSVGNATATSAGTVNLNSAGAGAMSLYKGISALTDSNSDNDTAGAINTAAGAYSTYKAADAYASGADLSLGGGAGSGSALGYIGPVLKAIYAQNNPKGAQNPDYRPAVGSAILNYFGFGWASDIVHSVAEPALNAAMDAGTESLGTFGAVMADPVGAPLSGQYEIGDLVSSTLDPANVFGGNPGGSTGALVGAIVDPVGAALGDTGVFSGVKDAVNTLETSDPVGNAVGEVLGQGDSGGGLPGPGKVICTQLAMDDKLDPELYKKAISPELVMKGQMLLGYHIIGVRLVNMMRKSERLSDFLAPYVADYIRHKAGQKNLKGFLVKAFLHPISWILGFFNTDPDYFKVLYPYRRNRKVSV